MDNLLVMNKVDSNYHLEKTELNLNEIKQIRLNCDIENYFFGKTKMGYLGLWVALKGDKTLDKKVEYIINMMPTTSNPGVHMFIGILNYYQYM